MTEELIKIERVMRVFFGITFLYASNLVLGSSSFIMSALGLYAIVTGFLGTCVFCSVIPKGW